MIDKYLVSKLDTISDLSGQYYPTAAEAGGLEGAFCIYTRISGEVQRDLQENPILYRDVYRIDIYHGETDILFALEQTVIDRLTATNEEFENIYIFSASAVPGAPDGFDLSMEVHQRSVTYTVTYWR